MNFFKGTLIAKVGAEAIFGIGIAPGILSKKGSIMINIFKILYQMSLFY